MDRYTEGLERRLEEEMSRREFSLRGRGKRVEGRGGWLGWSFGEMILLDREVSNKRCRVLGWLAGSRLGLVSGSHRHHRQFNSRGLHPGLWVISMSPHKTAFFKRRRPGNAKKGKGLGEAT